MELTSGFDTFDQLARYHRMRGADFEKFLETAVANYQLDVVHLLLDRFKPDVATREILGRPCHAREKMSLLLVNYCLNYEGRRPVMHWSNSHMWALESVLPNAVQYNQLDLARAILEGFELDLSDHYVAKTHEDELDGLLHTALRADGDIFPMVELLLDHNAPIHILSEGYLEQEGAGGGGRNTLQSAAARNHLKVFKLLVAQHGAELDLEFQGNAKEVGTAFYLAAKYGNLEVAKYLIDVGSNIDIVFGHAL